MQSIIMMCGPSASGKSTMANSFKKDFMYVSRDELRKLIFRYTDSDLESYYKREDLKNCEEIITKVHDSMVKDFIYSGESVIIDNTHLSRKYIDKYKTYNLPIKIIVPEFKDLHQLIQRDVLREKSVGEKVIVKQLVQFSKLEKDLNLDPDFEHNVLGWTWTPTLGFPNRIASSLEPASEQQNCIICDLDGTLSIMNGRSPYDGESCGSDLVNYSVLSALKMANLANVDILLFSGRNGESISQTRTWLAKNNVPYDLLSMRQPKDFRSDVDVKMDMYNEHVKDKYNVLFVLDDRDMVVQLWRSLGLNCFQVYYGNF